MIRDRHNIIPAVMALLLHVVILGSMVVAFDYARPMPFTPLAVKATLVQAVPEALARKREQSRPDDAAYVVIDCGSTTTKAVLLTRRDGAYRLVGHAEAPTTVEAPIEDVMVGVRSALELLQDQTGHSILRDQPELALVPPQGPAQGVGALLATSSAITANRIATGNRLGSSAMMPARRLTNSTETRATITTPTSSSDCS